MNIIKRVSTILIAVLILISSLTGCTKRGSFGKINDAIAKEIEANLSVIKKSKVGGIVYYGNYEQDNNALDGKEKIAWRVLVVENDKILLISEKILDCKPYNEVKKEISWENCTLRTWLNDDFINRAFTSNEQTVIAITELTNIGNPELGMKGGNNTKDKVFLLSINESRKYFTSDKARESQGTNYAISKGLQVSNDSLYVGNSNWWLRSCSMGPGGAGYVEHSGYDYFVFCIVNSSYVGVRPALWIKW